MPLTIYTATRTARVLIAQLKMNFLSPRGIFLCISGIIRQWQHGPGPLDLQAANEKTRARFSLNRNVCQCRGEQRKTSRLQCHTRRPVADPYSSFEQSDNCRRSDFQGELLSRARVNLLD